jgi:hypothetical protein
MIEVSYHLRRATGIFLALLALLTLLFAPNNALAQDRIDLKKRLQETEEELARTTTRRFFTGSSASMASWFRNRPRFSNSSGPSRSI